MFEEDSLKNKKHPSTKKGVINLCDYILSQHANEVNTVWKDFIEKVCSDARNELLKITSQGHKPTLVEITNFIYDNSMLNVVVQKLNNNEQDVLFYEPNLGIHTSKFSYIKLVLKEICIAFKMKDPVRDAIKIYELMQTDAPKNIKEGNFLNKNIVRFNNCYYNLKTNDYYPLDHPSFSDYQFTSKVEVDYVPWNNVDVTTKELVQRLFKDWSNGDKEVEQLLLQMIFASIEGWNRDKMFIIKGGGGNGKSTYLQIIKNILGNSSVEEINLHDFDDDNAVNKISQATKLVLGDDLSSKFRLVNKTIARLKSFVSGFGFQVNVKFEPNRIVEGGMMLIQATNTDVSFNEQSDAVIDRIKLVNWTNKNFRKDNTLNLKSLINKNSLNYSKTLHEGVVSYVFKKIDYFNKFIEPMSLKNETENMITKSDQVSMFCDYLKDCGTFSQEYILPKLCYYSYTQWCHISNLGKLSEREFYNRFEPLLVKNGFIKQENRKRLHQFDDLCMNISDYGSFGKDAEQLLKATSKNPLTFYANPTNKIDDVFIQKVKDDLESLDIDNIFDDYKVKRVILYLSKDPNHLDLRSKFSELFED